MCQTRHKTSVRILPLKKSKGVWIPVTYLAVGILHKALKTSTKDHGMITKQCNIKLEK